MNIVTHYTGSSLSCHQKEQRRNAFSFETEALKSSTRDALMDMEGKRIYQPGETIFWEDDPILHYFFIDKGTLKRYKLLPNGRSQIISFMVGGDFLIFPQRDCFSCTAEALSRLEVTAFPQAEFDKLLGSDLVLRELTFRAITRELSQTQQQILLLGRMPAVERVGHFLLGYFHYVNPNESKNTLKEDELPHIAFELPMTRTDIADYLGLTIETVSRVFSKLKKEGIIKLPKPNQVEVLRPDLIGYKK